MKSRTTTAITIAVLALIAAASALNSYYVGIATMTFLFVALATAWNIIGGMCGQFSLGHSVFVGLGGTGAAALSTRLGLDFWLSLILACGAAMAIAALLSLLTFRLRLGMLSFAIVTLALAEVAVLIVLSNDFLGGASGITWPRAAGPAIGPSGFYWLSFGLAVVFCALAAWILRSRMGFYLRAIRDDEPAAAAAGINVAAWKTAAMITSAALTAIAATVMSRYQVFVDPHQTVDPLISITIILYVVVGGLGTVRGPVLGAGILYPLGEILRGEFTAVTGISELIFGVLIIVVVLRAPGGLAAITSLRPRNPRRREPPTAQNPHPSLEKDEALPHG